MVYPCGLDDCLGNEHKREDTHVLVFNKFPPLPRKHDKASHGTVHRNNNYFSPDEFLIKLKHHLSHKSSDFPNFSGVSLLAMNNIILTINQFSFKII